MVREHEIAAARNPRARVWLDNTWAMSQPRRKQRRDRDNPLFDLLGGLGALVGFYVAFSTYKNGTPAQCSHPSAKAPIKHDSVFSTCLGQPLDHRLIIYGAGILIGAFVGLLLARLIPWPSRLRGE